MDCKCGHSINNHGPNGCILCVCENPASGQIARDRVVMMGYGDPGSGKTAAALSFANRFRTNVFYYLLADRDPTRLYRHFPNHDFSNVVIFDSHNAKDALKAIHDIQIMILDDGNHANHWVIYDTVSQMYKRSRDLYTMARYGQVYENVVAGRQIQGMQNNGKPGNVDPAILGLINGFQSTEWDIMRNKWYGEYVNPILYGTHANIIYLAQAVPFEDRGLKGPFVRKEPGKLAGTEGRFRATGQLPDVHPGMSAAVESVIHFGVQSGANVHEFYTVKETAAKWTDEPIQFLSFADSYYAEVVDNGAQPLG